MQHLRRFAESFHKNSRVKSWQYIKKYYPKYVSKTERFKELLLPYLSPDIDMIDLGCGRGKETSLVYKELTRHSYGLDISECVFSNPDDPQPASGQCL